MSSLVKARGPTREYRIGKHTSLDHVHVDVQCRRQRVNEKERAGNSTSKSPTRQVSREEWLWLALVNAARYLLCRGWSERESRYVRGIESNGGGAS